MSVLRAFRGPLEKAWSTGGPAMIFRSRRVSSRPDGTIVRCVLLLSVLAALVAAPAGAAPKRTIRRTFEVTVPVPLRAYLSPGSPVRCNVGGPGATGAHQVESFTAPAAGTLSVEVTGFRGDWDVVLFASGRRVAEGGPTRTPTVMSDGTLVETLVHTFTKAGPSEIVICNFAGSPYGTGKYTFTYAGPVRRA